MARKKMVKQGVGIVILVCAGLTEFLTYRNGWVVYHISDTGIFSNIIAGPVPNEPPKPRLMTIEETESDYNTTGRKISDR